MEKMKCSLFTIALVVSLFSGCSNQEENDLVNSSATVSSATETTTQTTAESATETTTNSTTEPTTESTLTALDSTLIIPEEYYAKLDSIVDYIDKRKAGKKVSKAKAKELYGIDEICTVDNSLDILYYAFLDLDEDNIAELAVVERYDETATPIIRELYTFYDDSVHHVVCGWARNRYYILNDMGIYNEGSNGAAYFSIARYKFDGKSHKLAFIDSYYSLDAKDVKAKTDDWIVYCYTTKESFVGSRNINSSAVKVLYDLKELDASSVYNITESDYYEYDNLISFKEYCDK